MGKLSKLIRDPKQFIRDAKLYRRYVGDPAPSASQTRASATQDRKPKSEPKPKRKPKQHPLPTLNLATETRVSALDQRLAKTSREFLRFKTSPESRDRVVGRIADRMRTFMSENGFAEGDVEHDVRDFLRSCENNPALGAARTTATGSLLWLFVLARNLDPRVIVESGVFKGASLFTLHSACPDAEIHAYDIDLSNLAFSRSDISFHEGDWSEALPTAKGGADFCYFDDHINNCLRIRQAYDQGFRHLVFDDSPDIGELHKWRFPGVPTIQMVHNQTLRPGEWVEWMWKDKKLRYTFREEDTKGVEDVVDRVVELPSLSALTGRPTGVQTYVRLKNGTGI